MMDGVSTYTRLLKLLADGKWYGENDLRTITPFPKHWIKELRYEGHEVAVGEGGASLVRLRIPDLRSAS